MDSQFLSWNYDRRFGLEIEVNASDGRDFIKMPLSEGELPKGIDYIADIIKENTKNRVSVEKWHYTHNNNSWVLKPDRSCGIEICTPVNKGWLGINDICRVLDVLNSDSTVVADSRCSLHVHVEVIDCTPRELSAILSWWIKCEPVFIDSVPYPRKISRFCEPIGVAMDSLDGMEYVSEMLAFNKYFSINTFHLTKKKRYTIEFRIMGNEACKDSYITRNWIRLLIHFVEMVKKRNCPGRYKSGNCWTGLLWLDFLDVMKVLGWDGEYELSKGMEELRNWFIYRIKNNVNTDCSGLWSKEFRRVTLLQIEEYIEKFKLSEEIRERRDTMYVEEYR